MLAALGVVVLAHSPYLIGAFDPNPALTTSGLVGPGVHSLVPGSTSIDPNAGFTSQANGHRAALDWIHGRLPWWNPWEGTGNPLAGGLASAAFFLPFVLLTLLPNGQMLLYLFLDLIAAWATYALLRHLGVRPWVCFAGSVLFGLNGTNAWFRYVADNPVAFLPVILLGIERTRSAALEGRRRGWVLITVGVASSLLASFPETAYLDGLIAAVWFLVRSGGVSRAMRWIMLRRVLIGMVAGVLIAAPLLVAFLDYLPYGNVGGHTSHAFGNASLAPQGLLSLFAPYGFGPIFGYSGSGAAAPTITGLWGSIGGYLTAATVLLAALGLLGRRHRPLRLGLGMATLVLVSRNFGFVPARDLINLLPTASTDAVFRYDSGAIAMGVVVLVALAIDDIVRGRMPRWVVGPVAGGVVLVGVLAVRRASSLHDQLVGSHVRLWWDLSLLWAIGTVGVVTLAILLGGRRLRPLVVIGLVVIEAVAMFAVPELSAPRDAHLDTAGVAFLRARVGTSRFFSFGVFSPNYGAYYGVKSADINDLPVPKTFANYALASLAPNAAVIGFDGVEQTNVTGPTPLQELPGHLAGYRQLGVDYVVLPHGTVPPPLPPGTLRAIYRDQVMDVYHLADAQPYATTNGRGCQVTILTTDAMKTDCRRSATLLRRETMMPGWTATVGSRTVVPTQTVDGFQAVAVPAGSATLHFSFTPPHETEAWLACLVGFVVLLIPVGSFRAQRSGGHDRTRRRRLLGRTRRTPHASGPHRPAHRRSSHP